MAFQQCLISFVDNADDSSQFTNRSVPEPAAPFIAPPRSNVLLAGEIVPESEHCEYQPTTDHCRGAYLTGSPILCLPASSDYDASHPSVDAHSSLAEADLAQSEALSVATTVGPKNCKVQLRTCDILSEIQSSIDIINPVTLDNHYVNSAITKISMTGLRGNATHISILGMEFTSQLSYDFCQMLTQAESLKISMQNPKESKLQFIGEIDCRWILTDRKLSVVVKDFFSHVKIFYWKWPFIELHFELCEPREILQSTPSDVPHPAFCITTSHPLIKAAVSDDNRVVYNLPNIAPLEDELQHMHATPDDGVTSTAETIKVACEDNSFGILLDSALLYSIIKDGLVGKAYPQTFETRVPIENSEITVLLKVLPFKSRSSHISIWAEVTAPSQTDGQVTLEVTAFDPQRDERLGHTVKRTEKLKCSDLGECERARIILDDVMSHTFAFYRSPDIELYIKIIAS